MQRLALFRLVVTLLPMTALLTACGGGNRAVVITVSNPITHEPISGAVVKAKATRFFIPAPPYMYVNPIEYEDFSTFSDHLGRAELRAYTERPTHIEVTAEGYFRFTGFLEYRGEDGDGSPRWLLDSPPTPVSSDDPLLEITISDAGS